MGRQERDTSLLLPKQNFCEVDQALTLTDPVHLDPDQLVDWDRSCWTQKGGWHPTFPRRRHGNSARSGSMRHRPLEDNPHRSCLISPLSSAPTFAMLNFPRNGDDRTVHVCLPTGFLL